MVWILPQVFPDFRVRVQMHKSGDTSKDPQMKHWGHFQWLDAVIWHRACDSVLFGLYKILVCMFAALFAHEIINDADLPVMSASY